MGRLQCFLILSMVAAGGPLVNGLSSAPINLLGRHALISPFRSSLWAVPQKGRADSFMRAVQASAADLDDERLAVSSSVEELTVEHAEVMELGTQELTQKVLNGLFLAVCFGWAAYTIFTIDAGMTRGWTQSEIAMRIPLDNWSNYESSLAEKPIFTKTLINVVIYLLGDWLSQTVFQKKNILDFDVSRTLKNGFIGLCFGPLVHQYYQFSDYILPVEAGLANRIQKVIMDQTIYLVVKCSIYISAVGLLAGDDWETCQQRVKDKIGGVVITAWKFWPLVHCITYSVIPARHRILWVNCVDLIWNAILATKAQRDPPQLEPSSEAMEESEVVVVHSMSFNDDGVVARQDIVMSLKPALLTYKTAELPESPSDEMMVTVSSTPDALTFNTTLQGQ